jgi:hypothetical protein
MANAAVNLVRRNVQPARADGAQAAAPLPPTTLEPTFVGSQSKAREWADKAIDLYQIGDIEQARQAVRQAEVWLARMHTFEGRFRGKRRSSGERPIRTAHTERRTEDPSRAAMSLFSSYRVPARGST